MRKIAFRIMSRTIGYRNRRKDTDLDEARAACRHYNITTKEEVPASGGDAVDIIYWRASDFRESKDPKKGTTLPLKPRKM
eukprot:5803747-Ditylum_brightwellii.AAC.1